MSKKTVVAALLGFVLVVSIFSSISSQGTKKTRDQIRIEVLEARLDVCAQALEIIADYKVLKGSKSKLRGISSNKYDFGPYETPTAAEMAWNNLRQKIVH